MAAANPVKGEVPLVLGDGRELVLVMDFHALVVAERAYGKPLAETMADAMRGFVGASCAILFGALQTHQPRLTLRDAEAMFASDGAAVEAALEAASAAAYPDAEAAGDRKPGNAQGGSSSGGSGAKPGSSRRRSGGKPRAPST